VQLRKIFVLFTVQTFVEVSQAAISVLFFGKLPKDQFALRIFLLIRRAFAEGYAVHKCESDTFHLSTSDS
jgi:hypothetical protein